MPAPTILIVSGSSDAPNYRKVTVSLERRGYTVILYSPNTVAEGTNECSLRLGADGALRITYQDREFNPEKIAAAWYRRPELYGLPKDDPRWLAFKDEYRAQQQNIFSLVPADRWLNSPENMEQAEIKIPQLLAAATVGFTIPETIISNRWDAVESFRHDEVIVKTIKRINLPGQNGGKVLPTTVVKRTALPKQASPYPGVWQPYIEKKREWRVTVVGDQVFSAAVYTAPDAKDDWRLHQFGPAVTFKTEKFPEAEQRKCIALLKRYRLRYGAFDFIESPDGTITFLEVNANGQFMWLENELGLPISEAIADELAAVAKRSL